MKVLHFFPSKLTRAKFVKPKAVPQKLYRLSWAWEMSRRYSSHPLTLPSSSLWVRCSHAKLIFKNRARNNERQTTWTNQPWTHSCSSVQYWKLTAIHKSVGMYQPVDACAWTNHMPRRIRIVRFMWINQAGSGMLLGSSFSNDQKLQALQATTAFPMQQWIRVNDRMKNIRCSYQDLNCSKYNERTYLT